jgi:hypothetical protein
MYDASVIAEELTEAEARKLWEKEAERLRNDGKAAEGWCVGVRHQGYGLWSVYVGKQDGEPLGEPPTLKAKRTRRKTS